LFFVFLLSTLAFAEPYQKGLVGRWKVEFQEPPEEKVVAAQLEALDLSHLVGRMKFDQSDSLILTIARNKFLIQAGNHLFESYNCALEMDEIAILTQQERLSPIPRAYQYQLEGDKLILTGEMHKLDDIPVVLKLRRVKAIPVFVTGKRGFMGKDGFVDVGHLVDYSRDQVKIRTEKGAPVTVIEFDSLTALDQLSILEPEKTLPEKIGKTMEDEANRLKGLNVLLSDEGAAAREPMYFTKKYFFNETIMSEGYMVTIYNTPLGEVTFRASGTGGGGSRGNLQYRYLVERNPAKLIIWVNEEQIPERDPG